MLENTGRDARRCSDGRTNAEAISCAKRSFELVQAFTLCDFGFTMDSVTEDGVAGLPDGNLAIYTYDSMGPATRGVCLRPNVSFVADEWPLCRTALVNLTDWRSGEPYEEPTSASEEFWPSSCAATAPHVAKDGIRIKLIAGENVLPDYERWRVRCEDAVGFEMIIGKDGRVRCARVRSVGSRPRNQALYDTIRARLMRWRFDPPTLHGKPIEARWGMQINPMRKGDPPLPGPQIYPFCP